MSYQNSYTPPQNGPTASVADCAAILKIGGGSVGCFIVRYRSKYCFAEKVALLAPANRPHRYFVKLKIEDPDDSLEFDDADYLSSLIQEDKSAGLILSGGCGHRTQKSAALAAIDLDINCQTISLNSSIVGGDPVSIGF